MLREHHESMGHRGLRRDIEPDPDLPQHFQAGWMQPLSRQPAGPLRACFEQRHPRALLCMGERAHAADRAGPDDGYVVVLPIRHSRQLLSSADAGRMVRSLLPQTRGTGGPGSCTAGFLRTHPGAGTLLPRRSRGESA